MSETLRLAFAGLGEAATLVLPEVAQLPYIQVTAAADQRERALERFRQEFEDETYTGVEDLVRSPKDYTHTRGHQRFYGLTVVTCDRGEMRQSQDGIFVYGNEDRWEVPVGEGLFGRQAEITELYEAVLHGQPMFTTAAGVRQHSRSASVCCSPPPNGARS